MDDKLNTINKNIHRLYRLKKVRNSPLVTDNKAELETKRLIAETAALDTYPTVAGEYLAAKFL